MPFTCVPNFSVLTSIVSYYFTYSQFLSVTPLVKREFLVKVPLVSEHHVLRLPVFLILLHSSLGATTRIRSLLPTSLSESVAFQLPYI